VVQQPLLLLDGIDLHIVVATVEHDELAAARRAESSAAIRERVVAARKHQ
jgi:magnesium chelatase family protein